MQLSSCVLLLLQTEHAVPTGTQQHRLAQLTDLVNSFQHQVGWTANNASA